jgi:hypothetical protein
LKVLKKKLYNPEFLTAGAFKIVRNFKPIPEETGLHEKNFQFPLGQLNFLKKANWTNNPPTQKNQFHQKIDIFHNKRTIY